MSDRQLGQVLVERGLVSAEALAEALAAQVGLGRRLGEVLLERGLLGEEALRWALAEQLDLPLVQPDPTSLDPEALALVPADVCRRYGVLPLVLAAGEEGREPILVVAAADPSHREALADVQARAGRRLRVVAALREDIVAALDRVHGPVPTADVAIRGGGLPLAGADLRRVLEDPTGAVLLGHLLGDVVARGEGGIHLCARGGEVRVEDLEGRLLFAGGETWHTILVDRLRQVAGLSGRGGAVVERGRCSLPGAGGERPVLFRVSILRGVEGEEAQVRLLRPEGEVRSLAALGLTSHQALIVRQALEKPGLVWVTAPGEEGLASTLFALLREAPASGRTVTVEEEVCYRSPDFLQVETLSLGASGRSDLLRELKSLDFDRVLVDRVGPGLVGELLALALRRRWVFAGAPEPSLGEALASWVPRAAELPLYALRLVVHQRLVPLLCPECREECVLGTGEREAAGRALPGHGPWWQEGAGCPACGGRGTRGARAFFEVLPVGASVREALWGAARGEHRLAAVLQGVEPTIRRQVADAVTRGEVSLSELWDLP